MDERNERRELLTLPTELERGDAFVVLSVGAGVLLFCWWALQRGVPPPLVIVPAIIAVGWMVTSRSATEVRGIGSIAVFARNKLGERDVHEWILAAAYFWRLTVWPVWHRYLYWFGLWTIGKHRGKCVQCARSSN